MQTGDIPAAAPVRSDLRSGAERGRATPLTVVDMSVDARALALAILATVAVVFTLAWAQSCTISLLLGILFAYTLHPLVVWCERIRTPRVAGSVVVMLGVSCALVLGTCSLRGQMQGILDQVPEAVSRLSAAIASARRGEPSTMQKVQTAASEIEKATSEATGLASTPRRAATRVVVDPPDFNVGDLLLIGQVAMVLFLTSFLLLSGDTYKGKLVRLTGPSLSRSKITVHILDDTNASIQRYMLMLLATNVLLGTFVTTWMTGRIARMNSAAVFVSLLLWAWPWGLRFAAEHSDHRHREGRGRARHATRIGGETAWRAGASSRAAMRFAESPSEEGPRIDRGREAHPIFSSTRHAASRKRLAKGFIRRRAAAACSRGPFAALTDRAQPA